MSELRSLAERPDCSIAEIRSAAPLGLLLLLLHIDVQ